MLIDLTSGHRYHKSFEGKDYKLVVQYMPFVIAVWAIESREGADVAVQLANLWVRTSLVQSTVYFQSFISLFFGIQLAKELWSPSFERAQVQGLYDRLVLCAETLVAFDERFRETRKLHVVRRLVSTFLTPLAQTLHVPDQLLRLGVPRSLAVEALEKQNKIVRKEKLERTNNHNASRDVATIEARKLTIRMLFEGARVGPNGKACVRFSLILFVHFVSHPTRIRFGKDLMAFIQRSDELRQLMGFTEPSPSGLNTPGAARFSTGPPRHNQEEHFLAVIPVGVKIDSRNFVKVGQFFCTADGHVYRLNEVTRDRVRANAVVIQPGPVGILSCCNTLGVQDEQIEVPNNLVHARVSAALINQTFVQNVFKFY